METRKMTIAEAKNYVKKTKYIVWSEEESEKLQKKLFEIGCGWIWGGQIVSNAEHPFLFVDNAMKITSVEKEAYRDFKEHTNTYMQTDDILNIEIEKPKFDPNTLEVYDKVLVRHNKQSKWLARLYEFSDGVEFHVTNGGGWKFCIPFNDETKHLHRTREEEPDFYKQN